MLAKMIYCDRYQRSGAFVEGLVKLVDLTIAACVLGEYFHVPGRLLSLILRFRCSFFFFFFVIGRF